MKQNFTIIQGAPEGMVAFLNVARSTAVFADGASRVTLLS
jgi:hypothetical protein